MKKLYKGIHKFQESYFKKEEDFFKRISKGQLKSKLGSVIILVMAVTFLKHLIEWEDPHGTFFYGIAIAVVSASLIAFSHFGGKD